MSEQLFDTRGVARLLRYNRKMLASFALLGAVGAIAVTALRPPTYTATSLVLVPESSSSATSADGAPISNDTATDSAIATSSSVLAPALAKMHSPLTPVEADQRVHAAPSGTNIVQISASGSTPRQAQSLANAVAGQLVSFVTSGGAAGLAAPDAQATQLNKQINSLTEQIQAIKLTLAGVGLTPSVIAEDNELLAALTTSQTNATLALSNVNSQIASAKLNADVSNVGTEVIQPATTASRPSPVARGLWLVVGAAIGFALGVVLGLLRRKDQRLSSRDQIAEAVGAPVVLSSNVGRWRGTSNWLEMLQSYELGSVERWNVQKAVGSLGLAGEGNLTVISLAEDSASVAGTCHVAIACAASGARTSLVLTSEDEASIALRNANDILAARSELPRPNLQVLRTVPPREDDTDVESAEFTIVSIVVDPANPTLPADAGAPGTVVLAVCSRAFTAQQLTRVLIFLGQQRYQVKGVFVINPPGDDETIGRPLQAQRADEVVRLRTMGGYAS